MDMLLMQAINSVVQAGYSPSYERVADCIQRWYQVARPPSGHNEQLLDQLLMNERLNSKYKWFLPFIIFTKQASNPRTVVAAYQEHSCTQPKIVHIYVHLGMNISFTFLFLRMMTPLHLPLLKFLLAGFQAQRYILLSRASNKKLPRIEYSHLLLLSLSMNPRFERSHPKLYYWGVKFYQVLFPSN